MLTEQLKDDFLYCEEIIKKHSKSFYYAFSKLPPEKANAIYAIYAFCRIADDYVDESASHEEKFEKISQLQIELDLFSENQEVNHPLWRALRYTFTQFELELEPFYDQLKGQFMDLNFTPPKTMTELEVYSYYVAGSVGLMILPIIATESWMKLKKSAIDLGIAMQLTNILRDVGEDYFENKRVYLPQNLVSVYYSLEDLNAGIISDSFTQMWEIIANRAELLYQQFFASVEKFDHDSQTAVALSAYLYKEILDAVRNANYDCLSKKNYVTKEQMDNIDMTFNRSAQLLFEER